MTFFINNLKDGSDILIDEEKICYVCYVADDVKNGSFVKTITGDIIPLSSNAAFEIIKHMTEGAIK